MNAGERPLRHVVYTCASIRGQPLRGLEKLDFQHVHPRAVEFDLDLTQSSTALDNLSMPPSPDSSPRLPASSVLCETSPQMPLESALSDMFIAHGSCPK